MEAKYGLSCDNCGNYFTSIEAFPKPHLCPRCLIVYKAGIREVVKQGVDIAYHPDRRDRPVVTVGANFEAINMLFKNKLKIIEYCEGRLIFIPEAKLKEWNLT